jgi:glycosyltransferase involved in cell wall biosynthesis
VIASVSGDLAKIVEDEELGLTASPEDPESLAVAFRAAYAMPPADIFEMGDRCRNYYNEKMSRTTSIDRIESILTECARTEPRTHAGI